jgi:hypothetical protein
MAYGFKLNGPIEGTASFMNVRRRGADLPIYKQILAFWFVSILAKGWPWNHACCWNSPCATDLDIEINYFEAVWTFDTFAAPAATSLSQKGRNTKH